MLAGYQGDLLVRVENGNESRYGVVGQRGDLGQNSMRGLTMKLYQRGMRSRLQSREAFLGR